MLTYAHILLTLLVRGLSMRGFPFSLVCAHLQAETQGLKDQVVLNLDSMVDSHCSVRRTGRKLQREEREITANGCLFLFSDSLW